MSERTSEATVSEIEQVHNKWDDGPAIFNISSIDCRYCGGNGTIRYHS
jgi:hypothetical protein